MRSLVILLLIYGAKHCVASTELCYKGDEDCPPCSVPGKSNFPSLWPLVGNLQLQLGAKKMDSEIKALDAANVLRFDFEEASNLWKKKDAYKQGEGGFERFSDCTIEGHSIEIYRRSRDALFEYFVCGSLPISKEKMVDLNTNLEGRSDWDQYALEVRLIEAFRERPAQRCIYWNVKYPWPLSNRSYVYCQAVREGPEATLIVAMDSSHESEPEGNDGSVRVTEYSTSFALVEGDEDDVSQFCLLYFDNPNGSIPTSIVNWAVSKAVPTFLKELVKASRA